MLTCWSFEDRSYFCRSQNSFRERNVYAVRRMLEAVKRSLKTSVARLSPPVDCVIRTKLIHGSGFKGFFFLRDNIKIFQTVGDLN
jgi:hypothetical protein